MKILLHSDDGDAHPMTAAAYDLIMAADISYSPWEQVEEMLLMAGMAKAKLEKGVTDHLEISIEGTLGLKSVAYARELAAHGAVTWIIDPASVEPVKREFGDLIKIAPLAR